MLLKYLEQAAAILIGNNVKRFPDQFEERIPIWVFDEQVLVTVESSKVDSIVKERASHWLTFSTRSMRIPNIYQGIGYHRSWFPRRIYEIESLAGMW